MAFKRTFLGFENGSIVVEALIFDEDLELQKGGAVKLIHFQ